VAVARGGVAASNAERTPSKAVISTWRSVVLGPTGCNGAGARAVFAGTAATVGGVIISAVAARDAKFLFAFGAVVAGVAAALAATPVKTP
jgi:hypothetical protein